MGATSVFPLPGRGLKRGVSVPRRAACIGDVGAEPRGTLGGGRARGEADAEMRGETHGVRGGGEGVITSLGGGGWADASRGGGASMGAADVEAGGEAAGEAKGEAAGTGRLRRGMG
jgi:hypothetical protein